MPTLTRFRSHVLLALVLIAAAGLRLRGLDWDDGHHLHPDERFIAMVEARLSDVDGPAAYLDSSASTLNPYNVGFETFAYGTLPMLAGRYAGRMAGVSGYDGTYLAGRFLSACVDLLTVWLAYRLTRRVADRPWALISAALMAGSPLAVQLSHYWTVDTWLTTFTAASLLAAVRFAQGHRDIGTVVLGGVAAGLAVATKVTGAAVLLPLGVGLALGGGSMPQSRLQALAAARAGAVVGLLAAITIRVSLPYAFAGEHLLSFQLDARWLEDLRRLSHLTQSVASMPPSIQWAGRTAFYPLWNLIVWGCSPFFGVPAILALAWMTSQVRARTPWAIALVPLLVHAGILAGYHGTTLVKSMRYLYPAYPTLAVLTALLCRRLVLGANRDAGQASWQAPWPAAWRAVVVGIAVGGTLLSGLALSSIHVREHTRVAASRWIYDNVPSGHRFVNETWDDALPLTLPGRNRAAYAGRDLDIVGEETPAKIEAIVEALSAADGLAVTSNRAYASLTRIPAVFPVARAYYGALFDGRLGFRLVADITSYPSIGPLRLPDDAAEEAFTVYDHPRVLLYARTPEFSADRVRALLVRALPYPPPSLAAWEQQPRGWQRTVRPVSPPRDHESPAVAQVPPRAGRIRSGSAAIAFYSAVWCIGLLAWPLVFGIFPRLQDRGWGFARLVGLLLATYTTRLLLWTGVVTNGRWLPWFGLGLLVLLSATMLRSRWRALIAFSVDHRHELLASEGMFVAGFALFVGLRALAPEIYWGEKPMDFSILNTLVRTPSLPPSDPWMAGRVFNYYYLGQAGIALLTELTQIPTRLTYNLAFGWLGGVIVQGSYALGLSWGHRRTAGVAAATLTVLVGNLAGVREWAWRGHGLGWDHFWATSRVVTDTVNEYPLWSLLFGDLHSHVFAMPCLLLVLAAILQMVRDAHAVDTTAAARVRAALVLGTVMGMQALTNAWDAPLLAGLGLVVVPAATLVVRGPLLPALGSTAGTAALVGLTAAVVAGPTWPVGAGSPAVRWDSTGAAPSIDIVTIFGLFLYLLGGWLVSTAAGRHRGRWSGIAPVVAMLLITLASVLAIEFLLVAGIVAFLAAATWSVQRPDRRLACVLAATGLLLILLPQHLVISDRLNTFFKIHLEAWVLLSVATAVLVFGRGRDHTPQWTLWTRPMRAGAWVLAALAVFTGTTAAHGMASRHFAAYSGPTLDGLRYLAEERPGEHAAVDWFASNVRGTPVLLEAQGPAYQDFGRISMYTGLPTVLGWERHVSQRGHPADDIEARRAAVATIYTSTDVGLVETLVRRYRIAYVYHGWLERRTYPRDGLDTFAAAPHLFEVAYEKADTRIYRVVGERGDAASR